ncbi:MAG: tetratricopeptide repeat protein [Proteobacteria bacterium]|nr:tetratricopeptide repeat protein [Pseudomonadota bacterium]
MKGVGSNCRHVQHYLLRRDELNAVRRSLLDVHLRRCAACRALAQDFAKIEAGAGEIEDIREDQTQKIYSQLIPAIHEITVGTEKKQPFGQPLWPRPAFAIGLGLSAAIAVLAFSRFEFMPPPEDVNKKSPEKIAAIIPKNITHRGLIDRHEGTVQVDGIDNMDKGSFAVKRGTRIAVNKDARFSFRIGELARIALFGETDWQLIASTETYVAIRLDKGRLAVEFEGSSGKILEITTPDSLVRVKGTVFTVEASNGETRVGVLEGLVEVVPRRGEPKTLEVGDGKLVIVPGSGKLTTVTDEQRSLAAELRLMDEYPEELTRFVKFDGSPERVKIEVNGRVLGTTPLAARLPAGPFTYRLTSPGMEPVVGNVVNRDSQKEVSFTLLPVEEYEPIADDSVDETKTKKRASRWARASRRGSTKPAWGLFKRARAAMTAGDIPYAIGLLERALESVSGNQVVRGLSLLAECYAAIGVYDKAAGIYDQIIEQAPNSAAAQNARYEVGRLSTDQLGDLSRARAAFTAYVASPLGGGLREEAYYSLCELNGREGAHRDALHCFNQFLRTFPGGLHWPDARLWRGVLYQTVERRWADAERDLLAFVRNRPRHPRSDEARYRVAIGRYQVGDKRGALRMISEYLRRHPSGQYRLRVERLRRAILDPNFSWELDSK